MVSQNISVALMTNTKMFYRENDKTKLFVDETQFPDILESKGKINATLQDINDHRREVRLTTRQPSLEYTTVLGTEVSIFLKMHISKMLLSLTLELSSNVSRVSMFKEG